MQASVEELAASARISLTTPTVPTAAPVPAAFTGLTARETEVLAHLVANRTNAEIAETLFISEKTVSVHVSNLLRKTDTGSRREVAALASCGLVGRRGARTRCWRSTNATRPPMGHCGAAGRFVVAQPSQAAIEGLIEPYRRARAVPHRGQWV